MVGSYADQWKGADDTEIKSLNEMRTFVKIKRSSVPKGAKILSTKTFTTAYFAIRPAALYATSGKKKELTTVIPSPPL